MARMILDIYHGERGIDLAKWKSRHGIWGVIPKCGGSDDRTWNRYEETTWVEQATQAKSLGLHVGAYYYSDALNAQQALEDAEHCVNECMRGVAIDLPIYLDIEERSQLNLSADRLTEIVVTFCERVKAAGYQAGIYSGYEGFSKMHVDGRGYSLWLACWQETWPSWATKYDLWQEGSMSLDGQRFHGNGEVDGPGKVDLDWASDDFVARIENGGQKMALKTFDPAEEAAEIHAFMCEDPRFGYSKSPRWGGDYNGGEVATFTSKAGYVYHIPCGSYDCSSSTITAWKLALSRTKHAHDLDDATYTGDMRRSFVNSGLFAAKYSPAKRGDLYLAEGKHVAMCQDGSPENDILSEFNRNEYRSDTGGKAGDQDGGESVIRPYYDDKWNTVLHYIGGFLEDVTYDGKDDAEVIGVLPILYDGSDGKVYYWDGSPECVPYHVSGEEKVALEKALGIKLKRLDKATADAIMGMCKARKQWREDGIAQEVCKQIS